MDIKKLTEKQTWKQLFNRAKRAANVVVQFSMVSLKIEDKAPYVRLRREMRELEAKVEVQMKELGRLIYGTHKGIPATSTQMHQILVYVDGLYMELNTLEKQSKALQGIQFCSSCGGENAPEYAYCRDCGNSLKAS